MFFVDTIEVSGLGNRSYLAGGEVSAVAVDPPRDVDQVVAAAARRGVALRTLWSRPAAEGAVPGRAAVAGAGLGAVTGVLGVGGGFFAVPALVGVLGMRMRNAVGTSLLVITVTRRPRRRPGRHGRGAGPGGRRTIHRGRDPRRMGRKRLAAKVSGHMLLIFALVLLAVAAFMLIDAVV